MDITGTLTDLWDKLEGWVAAIILALPNIIAAVLIVIVAAFLARTARRVIKNVVAKASGRMNRSSASVGSLLGTIGYVVVLAVGCFIALGVLQLDGVVTSLLAGAGIVGLALGFAFQDLASNFISGVLLAVRSPFDLGDILETNGHMGTVRDINLRATHIDTFEGQRVIVPNSAVLQNPMINYTHLRKRRVDLGVGVGYGDDLDHAERVAKEAIASVPGRDESRDVELFYTEFGDSSINFTVRFWVDFGKQTDFLSARHEAIKRVKAAFDREGVTIPFPIRTLDFDPNGGVALAKAWPKMAQDGGA
jgi:small conductance mechanosensitive channel